MTIAAQENATPSDIEGVELGYHGKECSFDALVKKYHLDANPAIVLLACIVNGPDTDNSLWNQSEAAGLNAIAEVFDTWGSATTHEINAA